MKLKEILEKEISVSPEGEIKVLNEKEAIEYTDNDIIIHGKDEDIIIANKNVGAKISGLEKNSYGDYFTFDDAAKVAPAGYHIPAQWELVRVINILCELGIMKDSDDGENFSKTLKLPLAGFFDNLQEYHDSYGYYRSSSPLSSYAYSLYFHASLVSTHSFTHRSLAFPVRCFKDSI